MIYSDNLPFNRQKDIAVLLFLLSIFALRAVGQELQSTPSKDSAAAASKEQTALELRDTSVHNVQALVLELSPEKMALMLPMSLKTLSPDIPSSLQQAMTLSLLLHHCGRIETLQLH